MEYELRTEHDARKSFYGKARIRTEDGKKILRSYSTDVAYIQDGKPTIRDTYSPTTLRHIKEFLKQEGFRADSKNQILRDYAK
jgi:ribosomal protein L34